MKMRYILFVVAALTFLVAFWRFSNMKERTAIQDINLVSTQTIVKFDKTFIDVGVQKLKVPVEVDFIIYNTGKNDLRILNVEPDCHCTVASFPKVVIRPNDSASIRLKYDASNLGPFQSSATTTTNSNPSAALLVFRGIVEK